MANGSKTEAVKAKSTGGNGVGIAGLICGIVGIFMLQLLLGPAAIILGIIAKRKGQKYGTAAIILGIVDILLVLMILAFIALVWGTVAMGVITSIASAGLS